MPPNATRAMKAVIQEFFQLYPDEAARTMEDLPVPEVVRLLEAASAGHAVSLAGRLNPDIASEAVARLNDPLSRQILSSLDPARSAALIARMDGDVRRQKLALLDAGTAKTVQSILTFPPDSAGALMDPQVMTFLPETTIQSVLSRLRQRRQKRVQDVFVVNSDGQLLGAVPLQDIAVSPLTDQVSTLIVGRPVSVLTMETKEAVVDLMSHRRLASLPVIDHEGHLLGVIRYDALITATQEEATADIQTMVGASKEERALSKASFAVRKRLPWLEINLVTAFAAASVVGIFEGIIAQFTALAVLLPVVAGQSGNTGAQALAVTMRGLALREIRVYQWFRVLVKELQAGLINGIVIAITTSIAVYAWSRSPGLALVIGLSMVLSMVAAGASGVAVPVLLTVAGQDPAQSSSIILTTVTDVVGFFSFLGIATMLSGML